MQEFLKKPSTDFGAVRDGRQTLPFYVDVDLSIARSITAGTALKLEIAGNSFFTDADTTNGGNAVIHFQDVSYGTTSAPFFVSPGFIANVGFTQLMVENLAQPGKRLRIFYGVDIDFQAGVNASIAIAGNVSVIPSLGNTNYADSTPLAANTARQVIAPAANLNGLILTNVWARTYNSVAAPIMTLVAKNSAPANITDGQVLCGVLSAQTNISGFVELKKDIYVPPGLGLYFISDTAETSGNHTCSYRLL